MNCESLKNEFIKLKKEELEYIDNIAKISSSKKMSEEEKLEIHRNLKKYNLKLNEILKKLWHEVANLEKITREKLQEVIIEFDIDENYLSKASFYYEEQKKYVLQDLWINPETFKFELTLYNLYRCNEYRGINPDIIQNNQKLMENPIYVFKGYYDSSEECYGPCFGDPDSYIYGIYESVCSKCNDEKQIQKSLVEEFEKNNTIIHSRRYVDSYEIKDIFKEELLNVKNKTLEDCVIETQNRIEKLNYIRSPEYKEKILLDRINELYKNVLGEFIEKEILYSGAFLSILSETYKLPNEKIVKKEKLIKNSGKNSVIVVAITQDKEYIVTFQNRIKDKLIAEFPSGYIENNESPIDAAKRELKEETGYITDDLFVIDEAFTSPGTDNSITYIVIANNCTKTAEKNNNQTELVNHGLFTEAELNYLVYKNIINGAMNKLAYYNLITNVENCNTIDLKNNKKIYKKVKNKTNPLTN